MKVNIQIDPALSEEYVEFHVRAITNEISRYASIIEKSDRVITGTDQFDRITIVDPNEIVAVHADKKWCRIYTNNAPLMMSATRLPVFPETMSFNEYFINPP